MLLELRIVQAVILYISVMFNQNDKLGALSASQGSNRRILDETKKKYKSM